MDYYFLGAPARGVLTDYYFWAAGRTRAPAPRGDGEPASRSTARPLRNQGLEEGNVMEQ